MLRRCPSCRKYTLKEVCCLKTESPHPPNFSPADKYGKYRRAVKRKERGHDENTRENS